ncbi:MAG: glycoside hydrolase family 32 protein [Thermoguttaceae bacterium]
MPRFVTIILALGPLITGMTICAAEGPVKEGSNFGSPATLYREKYRPQFHVTARQWTVHKLNPGRREEGWINDINGLIYHKEQYHLFAQRWARCWLHFVSKDLVHWAELQPAFWDDDRFGTGVQSGTIVFDAQNVSGLSRDPKKPPLVAFWSGFDNRSQCISYSVDDGLSWTKYAKNPYMIHSERDPDVFWYEPKKQWVLVLTDNGAYRFFASKNLLNWTEQNDSIPNSHECPDMFPLPVDGDLNRQKWVVVRGNGRYSIGGFDGARFTPEVDQQPCDLGANFYATQSWGNIAGRPGRRVQIAWMNGGKYPDMPFNQQLTFPCDMKLRLFPEGLRICRLPVGEIKSIYAKEHIWKNKTVRPGENLLKDVSGDLFDIQLQVDLAGAQDFGIKCRGYAVTYSSEKKTLTCLGRTAPVDAVNGQIILRILVDRTSIEVFANDGKVSMSSCCLTDKEKAGLELFSDGPSPKIASMTVYELKSIWPTPNDGQTR